MSTYAGFIKTETIGRARKASLMLGTTQGGKTAKRRQALNVGGGVALDSLLLESDFVF